jgi:hypothetical protein
MALLVLLLLISIISAIMENSPGSTYFDPEISPTRKEYREALRRRTIAPVQ